MFLCYMEEARKWQSHFLFNSIELISDGLNYQRFHLTLSFAVKKGIMNAYAKGGLSMDCQRAQSLINKYVHNELDLNTLEDFLVHVEQCPDCMEELEVYYIVFQGFRRLDEDENIAVNYHEEFLKTLTDNENKIKHTRNMQIIRRTAFFGLLIAVMVVSNLSINLGEVNEKLIYRSEGKSEYILPTYFFQNKKTKIDEYLLQNYGIDFDTLSNTNIDLTKIKKKSQSNGTSEGSTTKETGALKETTPKEQFKEELEYE